MANTYTLIEAQTLGSSAASVTFSAIPATYTDLKVVVSARNTATSGSNLYIRFNSITSGYSGKYLEGDGASGGSGATSTSYLQVGNVNLSSTTASTFASTDIYIPNYLSSNYKSVSADSVSENNATTAYATLLATLLSNTAAITQIDLSPSANSFATYSSFYLYGISNS